MTHTNPSPMPNKNNGINELLIIATAERNISRVRDALNNGANADYEEKDGWTALIIASYAGYIEIVRLLLAAGANIDLKGRQGFTALISATLGRQFGGQPEVVRLLLAAGANVNIRSNKGNTALMFAIGEGHTEIERLLREAGATE